MPKLIWRRLFWVLDLITGVRGVHWSWNPSPSPPYHPSLSNACSGRTASFSRNGSHFLIDYFLIDLIKCLMVADPYFIGYPSPRPPPHIAPYITSPLALYFYRMLLAVAGAYIAIDLVFAFAVLLQVNVLGPNVLGLNASPVMFPPLWGSPRAVLRKGLRGFWGETWHQMFRMHFESIGDAVAECLLRKHDPGSWGCRSVDKRQGGYLKLSGARVVIRVVTVFLLSGALHACASYTLLGPTRPWAPFLFFALQPLGMAIQSACSQHFVRSYLSDSPGYWRTLLRQGSNFGFTILWLWACSGIFMDDMTSGGIWLFEPIPLSLIRGLEFSKEDKRFWCW
jgi:Membrane bound O-acyl transferase family